MEEEIWKDIPEYEGLYQVSNFGRVKGLKREVSCRWNNNKKLSEKHLKTLTYKVGYEYIYLSKNGIRVRYKVHRIVAKTFIPNPENKREVNHKNGIKSDNMVTNLEWVTSRENQLHAFKNGLQVAKNGKEHHLSKTVLKMTLLGSIVSIYDNVRIAALENNTSQSSIATACRANTKHIGHLWKYKKCII